jgi:transcriptional regulator with XRE-family HTH domain
MHAPITPAQSRAARGLLNWSRQDLADRAHVRKQTVWEFETEKRTSNPSTVQNLRRALEDAGVRFTESGGVEPGRSP